MASFDVEDIFKSFTIHDEEDSQVVDIQETNICGIEADIEQYQLLNRMLKRAVDRTVRFTFDNKILIVLRCQAKLYRSNVELKYLNGHARLITDFLEIPAHASASPRKNFSSIESEEMRKVMDILINTENIESSIDNKQTNDKDPIKCDHDLDAFCAETRTGKNKGKWFAKCPLEDEEKCSFWTWIKQPDISDLPPAIQPVVTESNDRFIKPTDSVSQQGSKTTSTDYAEEHINSYVLAKMFVMRYRHLFILNGGSTLFHFNGRHWERDSGKNGYSITMSELFSGEFYLIIDEWITENFFHKLSSRQFDAVKKYALKLRESRFKKDLQFEVMMSEGLQRDVVFDTNPYLLGFQNGVMDFEKDEFRPGQPEDYICSSLSYEWQPPREEEIEFVEGIFKQIFPNEENRVLMMQLLYTCLIGRRVEHFIIANGRGGNGKDLVFGTIMPTVLETHYVKSKNQLLLDDLPSGACQELAEMNKKRMVVFSEPCSSKKLITETVKELTGSNAINARELYSKNTETHIYGTFIMMCNTKPRLDKSDEAMKRRIIDFPFESSFVTPQDLKNYPEEDIGKTVFLKNTEYSTVPFWKNYRCAVIEYLKKFKNNSGVFTIPENIQKRNEEYLSDSDFIQRWMKEHYEHTGNKLDFVRLSDIYDLFKQSELWVNMDKRSKRELNKSAFVKLISEHYYYRRFFVDYDKLMLNDARTTIRTFLKGFRLLETSSDTTQQKDPETPNSAPLLEKNSGKECL